MAATPGTVQGEFMIMKKFKKETGYDAVIKKLYDKSLKAKAKPFTANVTYPKTTFTPGPKGKVAVPSIINKKIKEVKRGPAKDKIVVVTTEGDAKKKTYIMAMRFATEDDAKTFHSISKAKGVEPLTEPETPPPPASTTSPPRTGLSPDTRRSPSPPPPPLTPSISSRGNSINQQQSQISLTESPPRGQVQPQPTPARSLTSSSFSSSYNVAPLPRASAAPSSPSTRSPSRQDNLKSKTRSRSSSSSSSSSLSRSRSRPIKRNNSSESRVTFISTDPSDFLGRSSKKHEPRTNGHNSGYGSSDRELIRRRSRKDVETVQVFTLKPGKGPSRPESARMYYVTSRPRGQQSRSSSSSSSSRSSSSSSESIATRWMQDRSGGRLSNHQTRSRGRVVELKQRPYSMGPTTLRRRGSISSSSSSSSSYTSSSSSSSTSAGGKRFQKIRIKRKVSSSSSSSRSSSYSSASIKYTSSRKNRPTHGGTYRIITPR